jgi:hypothetical protein
MNLLANLLWRVLRPVLEDAWEDGHNAGWKDCENYRLQVDCVGPALVEPDPTLNPYRKEAHQ